MADRMALVIGVDTHQETNLPDAAHAEADARAVVEALAVAGWPRENIVALLGSQASKTAIESRLRKLAKPAAGAPAATGEFFVFISTLAFGEDEDGLLACFDTQPDDLADTSVPLALVLKTIKAYPGRVSLFLDPRQGVGTEPFPVAPLEAFFATRKNQGCFLSCLPGENSHVSGSLKSGVWAHLLLQTLTGKVPTALAGERVLTSTSFMSYLEQELPRTLRATFREAPAQTPVYYGPPDLTVADLAGVVNQAGVTADPRLQPLKRGTLCSETTAKVKSLGGYRKSHRLPDKVNAYARKFVGDLAAEDVKADVDHTYAAIREHMGYKRRDVEGSSDKATGVVRTPDFEYSVSIELTEDDPTTVVWRREVTGIRTPEVVLSKAFGLAFGETFDTLVFEFTRPFALETWVDRIEDEAPPGVKLRCASDCSTCDVMVAGSVGVIRLSRDRVEVRSAGTGRAAASNGLVEAFLHFQDLFSGRRDLQELPLLEVKS